MIAWDYDGTLVYTRAHGTEWRSEAHLGTASSPRLDVIAAAKRLGDSITVVTGRTHLVHGVTLHALEQHFSDVRLFTRPPQIPFPQLARWKADMLRALGCTLYVGDSASDEAAAAMAGCEFVKPERFLGKVIA